MALLALMAAVSGCSSMDGGAQIGELGNGGFYFACDNAVSCDPFEQDAAKFPKAVSLGSAFTVRFVPKSDTSGTPIDFDDRRPDRGVTVGPVGQQFISRGAQSLVAVKAGFGTLVSRDASGKVIDFTVLRIARPDTLVVYAADDVTSRPGAVEELTLSRGERRSFRAFAQENKEVLGGSLQVEWRSNDPAVLTVEGTADGRATIVAKAPGVTKLLATGGTFTHEIQVQVGP